jgi:hypothetical protein
VKEKILVSALILIQCGCASKQPCPDVSEEPVSECRAKQACIGNKWTHGIALILGGMGAGANGTNQAQKTTDDCIDRNLSAQRSNAGIQSAEVKCVSERISNTEIVTKCAPN